MKRRGRKTDKIYAVRIIGRSGYQRSNSYWKLGWYIRTSITLDDGERAVLGAAQLAEADFGSLRSIQALYKRMRTQFPELETEIVTFSEIPRRKPKRRARAG